MKRYLKTICFVNILAILITALCFTLTANNETETEIEIKETESDVKSVGEKILNKVKENNKKSDSNGNVIFLLYHDLVKGSLVDEILPDYTTTSAKFREDIETLLANNWKSISCEMYLNGNYSKSENYFVVTFDDGYLSNYTIAYPVLKELNVYGDIFMCTASVSLSNHFKWDQGREMEESGYIKLYSHTHNHQAFYEITCETPEYTFAHRTLLASSYISNIIGGTHSRIMSYPNSSYNEDVAKLLYDMGYKIQFVQIMPEDYGYDWNAEDYGLVFRYSISFDTDIMKIIEGL